MGHLVPNLEIAHHPFRKRQTYEVQLGANALNTVGKKRWNLRLAKAIQLLDRVINFDHLYIGGGNAKKVTIALPSHATIVSNTAGLLGGIALWADPNVSLPHTIKASDKGPARKRAPRRKLASKTLKKKENMTLINGLTLRLLPHRGVAHLRPEENRLANSRP